MAKTEAELLREAAAVDRASKKLRARAREAFVQEGGQATVMALCLLACHTALHDGATEEDVQRVLKAAWKKSVDVHSTCGSA